MSVVSIHTENFVRTLTMDRPEALNAFNAEMMDELCDAFMAAAEDDSVRVLVLTGAGRAFSAGADLKAGTLNDTDKSGKRDLRSMLSAIIDFPKPFIIAANGLGVGIGMTIHGLADLCFMAHSAKFKTPFSSLGLTAEACSTYTFSRLLGHQKASWVLLSGDWFSATQCAEMGLATAVVPDEELMSVVYEKANALAALPLDSLIQTKKLIMAPHIEAMKQAVYEEGKGLASLVGSPANREAMAAFAEKRQPDFSNL
jgi:enoyl-CoA hydratase/carnithine racemase